MGSVGRNVPAGSFRHRPGDSQASTWVLSMSTARTVTGLYGACPTYGGSRPNDDHDDDCSVPGRLSVRAAACMRSSPLASSSMSRHGRRPGLPSEQRRRPGERAVAHRADERCCRRRGPVSGAPSADPSSRMDISSRTPIVAAAAAAVHALANSVISHVSPGSCRLLLVPCRDLHHACRAGYAGRDRHEEEPAHCSIRFPVAICSRRISSRCSDTRRRRRWLLSHRSGSFPSRHASS